MNFLSYRYWKSYNIKKWIFGGEISELYYNVFNDIFKLNNNSEVKGINNWAIEKDECISIITL